MNRRSERPKRQDQGSRKKGEGTKLVRRLVRRNEERRTRSAIEREHTPEELPEIVVVGPAFQNPRLERRFYFSTPIENTLEIPLKSSREEYFTPNYQQELSSLIAL
ncbi:hypothetical protein GOBAR_DD12380 [Gossypium barbadense]|nr:hypothetical protein GOBAR_DD12380 [Gossypium barbadense]